MVLGIGIGLGVMGGAFLAFDQSCRLVWYNMVSNAEFPLLSQSPRAMLKSDHYFYCISGL